MAKDCYTLNFCYFITCIKVSKIMKRGLNPVTHNLIKQCVIDTLSDEQAPDGLRALTEPHWDFSSVWLRIFSAAWCLPVIPPRLSGLGEEQVNVGQLLKPLPAYSHVKLPALQLIPINHLSPIIRVETAAQHTVSL